MTWSLESANSVDPDLRHMPFSPRLNCSSGMPVPDSTGRRGSCGEYLVNYSIDVFLRLATRGRCGCVSGCAIIFS